jgi:histidinol-phosphate aminotransferase
MNKDLWSESAKSLTPYVPGEQPKIKDLVKLNTNENPFPPSMRVAEKLSVLLDSDGLRQAKELRLYPDPQCLELRAAVAKNCLNSSEYNSEKIFIGNGSDDILSMAFMAFWSGKQIVAPDVTYSFYPVWAKLVGADYKAIPLRSDFSIPTERFLEPSGGVIIANPNAPTGILMPLKDIELIVAADPNRVVIIDEAYIDFAPDNSSAVGLTTSYPNLLVTRTMSKSYSLAGLRVGWAIGHPSLISALTVIRDSVNSYTVGYLAQAGAIAALSDKRYFNKRRKEIIALRETWSKQLYELNFNLTKSEANFIFAQHAKMDGDELYNKLRERGILVRYFNLPRIDDHLRITVGNDTQMEQLYNALLEILG